jgi:hypothetical protein
MVEHAAPGRVVRPGESKMATIMLAGMLIMSLAAWFYAIAIVLARVRVIIMERERGTAWIAEILRGRA